MTLADARALVPGLTVADAEPAADAKALAALTDWCSRYSPWSAVDGADGIRLDITGCAHLFGGEAAMLLQDAEAPAGAPSGFDAARRHRRYAGRRLGLGAASPVSRRNSPILQLAKPHPLLPLPVAALRLPAETVDVAAGAGPAPVGAVAALPRGPLAKRLGDEPCCCGWTGCSAARSNRFPPVRSPSPGSAA